MPVGIFTRTLYHILYIFSIILQARYIFRERYTKYFFIFVKKVFLRRWRCGRAANAQNAKWTPSTTLWSPLSRLRARARGASANEIRYADEITMWWNLPGADEIPCGCYSPSVFLEKKTPVSPAGSGTSGSKNPLESHSSPSVSLRYLYTGEAHSHRCRGALTEGEPK